MGRTDALLLRQRVTAPSTETTAKSTVGSAPVGPGHERLLALQRQLGNRAVVGMIGSSVTAPPRVRRLVEDDEEVGIERGFNTGDLVGSEISTFSGMGGIQGNDYQLGDNTTSGAGGGVAGSLIGDLTSMYGVVSNSRSVHKAIKTKKSEEEKGRKGEGTWKESDRTHRIAGANLGQSVGNFGSNVLNGLSGVSQIVANGGSTSAFAGANNALGGAGGMLALPVQILSTIRTARKAAKQWARVVALRAQIDNPNAKLEDAKNALEKQIESVDGLKKAREGLEGELSTAQGQLAKAQSRLAKLQDGKKSRRDVKAQQKEVTGIKKVVADVEEAIDALGHTIAKGEQETGRLQTAKDKAEDALNNAAGRIKDGKENPDDIRAYALHKSESGFMKKIIGVVGGVLGIGGGIAGTVASIAAIGATTVVATTTLATPIGWALCGSAALVALGLGGYAFWKWASKKYKRARAEKMSKGKAFLVAINPFQKVGTSRRRRNAERLYYYAAGNDPDNPGQKLTDTTERDEARQVIMELGLDWVALHLDEIDHKDAAINLIQAKMGS
jgi:flagellar biosynthesis chaperone FliJ